MDRRIAAAAAIMLALAACKQEKPKATFIDDPHAWASPDTRQGSVESVYKAAAVNYIDGLYRGYAMGHAVSLPDVAAADLKEAMRLGKPPPMDPLCNCTSFGKTTHVVQITDAKPPQSLTALVAFTSFGRREGIYIFLVMTPLGWKVQDVATDSMRDGLLYYLRSHPKSDEELDEQRRLAIEQCGEEQC